MQICNIVEIDYQNLTNYIACYKLKKNNTLFYPIVTVTFDSFIVKLDPSSLLDIKVC